MSITLYYEPASTPCRAVLMVARELDIKLDLKRLDLEAKEHLKPEYVAINPQHTVPTMIDQDGFVLWESRAIMQYLCNKNNKNQVSKDLYPSDFKKRAIVDRILAFDLDPFYNNLSDFFDPQVFSGVAPDQEKHQKFKQDMRLLDLFIGDDPYVTGDELTIADLSLFSSLCGINVCLEYDFSQWKNVSRWMKKLEKELPYNKEINIVPTLQLLEEAKKDWLP